MLFLGLGIGQCMQPLTIIVQNAVPPREIGVATSSATFFRQLGGTLGVAVFLSLLFSTLGDNIKDAFKTPRPGSSRPPQAGEIPHTALNDQVLAGLQQPGRAVGSSPRSRTTPRSSGKMARCWRTRSRSASPTR